MDVGGVGGGGGGNGNCCGCHSEKLPQKSVRSQNNNANVQFDQKAKENSFDSHELEMRFIFHL